MVTDRKGIKLSFGKTHTKLFTNIDVCGKTIFKEM